MDWFLYDNGLRHERVKKEKGWRKLRFRNDILRTMGEREGIYVAKIYQTI